MGRESRIQHPPGELFVTGHRWVARQEGLAVALVLGAIDFLDRVRERSGEPVASRSRLLADLEGFVGRDAVDKALKRLVELGWVARHDRTELGRANLIRTAEFSLVASAVRPGVRNSGRRVSEIPDGNPDGAPDDHPDTVYKKNIKKEEKACRVAGELFLANVRKRSQVKNATT